jgi:uncharacterized linocin/CFP29 family protein
MNHLLRDLAPIPEAASHEIEEEATRTLHHFLTACRLVDFSGPHGWDRSAEPLGRSEPLPDAPAGAEARQRRVLPILELRTRFTLDRAQLDDVERGARDVDLDAVRDAARPLALAEDTTIFQGNAGAGIRNIAPASPHADLAISDDYREYPSTAARAVAMLQQVGVASPFAVALGPRCDMGVIETTEHGGYPVLEHLRLIAGGPVLWAPAVVLSTRGCDFELSVGQDPAIGYESHTDTSVTLYLEESFTFQVLTPEAAVRLSYVD